MFKKEKRYMVVWEDSEDVRGKSDRPVYTAIRFRHTSVLTCAEWHLLKMWTKG